MAAAGNDVKFRVSVDTGGAPQELDRLGEAMGRASKEAEELAASGKTVAAMLDEKDKALQASIAADRKSVV